MPSSSAASRDRGDMVEVRMGLIQSTARPRACVPDCGHDVRYGQAMTRSTRRAVAMMEATFPSPPPMPEPLSLRRAGPVLHLVLDRPGLHNAFDADLVARLTDALEQAARDDSVRVVVLAGAGASFSAGADLNWMRGMAAAGEAANREDALALARLMRTLDELPRPTIARVHGAAFGGGVGLVACCDIAIGVPGAKFGLTESRLGLLPAVISPYVVAAIGPRQARRWFATAEVFDAAQALVMGLLHEVVEPDALDASVERQVALLLKAGPRASAQAKQLVRAVALQPDRDLLDRSNAELIAALRVSPEGQEGLGAFLDKRPAAWCSDPQVG